MTEAIGILEFDLKGEIKEKSGDFANEDNEAFIQNVMYILQDINAIKIKKQSVGQFVKMRIRNEKMKYDIAVGANSVKVKKYN